MEHVCRCPGCAPEQFPQGERQGPEHVAVRFYDAHGGLEVWLDGERVECFEAVAGEPGAVYLHRQPLHQCGTCFQGLCAESRLGLVELRGERSGIRCCCTACGAPTHLTVVQVMKRFQGFCSTACRDRWREVERSLMRL